MTMQMSPHLQRTLEFVLAPWKMARQHAALRLRLWITARRQHALAGREKLRALLVDDLAALKRARTSAI